LSTAYRDCDGEPAALIEALEKERDHTYPLDEWGQLLLAICPHEHRERRRPPKPDYKLTDTEWLAVLRPLAGERAVNAPRPGQPVSDEQRIRLMRWRVSRGRQPIHPEDSWVRNPDILGGFVVRNGRNGAEYQGEEVRRG
jgi:hypothetical protein